MPLRLIGMGGTITFAATPRGAFPELDAEQLAAPLTSSFDIDTVDLMAGSSISITGDDLRSLAGEIERSAEAGYEGVVVAHGTDTMEETAYFVALTVGRELPVAFTGAMHHPGAPASDGGANLADAFAFVARCKGARAAGPVVIMDGQIHAARFVTKADSTSTAAFRSPGAGPIGAVTEGRPSIWFQPSYVDYVGSAHGTWPRVELVHLTNAVDAASLAGLLDNPRQGVVVAGYGGGHVHPGLLPVFDDLIRSGLPVVVATRCASGDTLRSTYAVEGTELDLQARGFLMAGRLAAEKARLRLIVAIANGVAPSAAFPVE